METNETNEKDVKDVKDVKEKKPRVSGAGAGGGRAARFLVLPDGVRIACDHVVRYQFDFNSVWFWLVDGTSVRCWMDGMSKQDAMAWLDGQFGARPIWS